jgi:TetR/AcrR family transcriptional regulator, tetracycline repressor protein
MARPRFPLIDREEAIAKALELIDSDGIEAFSIRKLGAALGVNGTSLYHHFKDKDEILRGVQRLIMRQAKVVPPPARNATWQDYAVKSVTRYRAALLAHPNAAPLVVANAFRATGMAQRDYIIGKMLADGVPAQYCHPIIDSVETLAFGSALFNPQQAPTSGRFPAGALNETPNLALAVRSAPRTADRMFRLELRALLDGWTALITRERDEDGRGAQAGPA